MIRKRILMRCVKSSLSSTKEKGLAGQRPRAHSLHTYEPRRIRTGLRPFIAFHRHKLEQLSPNNKRLGIRLLCMVKRRRRMGFLSQQRKKYVIVRSYKYTINFPGAKERFKHHSMIHPTKVRACVRHNPVILPHLHRHE